MATADDPLRLCTFCGSVDWTLLTTGPFHGRKLRLKNELSENPKSIFVIQPLDHRDASLITCDLCKLIESASRGRSAWWPMTNLRDHHWSSLVSSPGDIFWVALGKFIDSIYGREIAEVSPLQVLMNGLARRGVRIGGGGGGMKRNTNSNILLMNMGLTPIDWATQTFVQLHPCLYPVPSVDDYVTDDEPLAVYPSARLVRNEVNVGLLRRWYTTCREKHGEMCSSRTWLTANTPWPKKLRLIDVRSSCIVEAPAGCDYFALSYVWGNEKNSFQATIAQLEAMKSPGFFGAQALPKTIADAMELTKGMGIGYLWVDRLCVIQDSDADKAVQIPQMDLVYCHAAMTIVATDGTALDGLPGINGTSRILEQNTARIAIDLGFMDVLHMDQNYENSLWTTRGWTFQESLCSKRILIITSSQVFWSCATSKCCETIAFEAFPTATSPDDILFNVLSEHRVFNEVGGAHNFTIDELGSMIKNYCLRKLTAEEDALDAFTGILRRVAVNTGHEFYWGHSVSTRFDESLAWVNSVKHGELEYRRPEEAERRREMHRARASDGTVRELHFPSWSWLGWKNVLGVSRAVPKQVVTQSELEIMKLGVNGKAAKLCSTGGRKFESVMELDMQGIDQSTSAGWKEDTSIDPSLLHTDADGKFMDSGRLLFWTSHAILTMDGYKISNAAGDKIGELLSTPSSPKLRATGKHSCIVVSRKYDDENRKIPTGVLRAERILNVLLVEWEDKEKHIASRTHVGVVKEADWVGLGELREWILVTLT
ncbi:HET-domain-containing protein [Annulohypoxylon nitens]|nr:HET-domain-containing protein [Annulohypoxylon nitens]